MATAFPPVIHEAIEAWLKNNIQLNQYGTSALEISVKSIKKAIDGLHYNYTIEELTPIAKDLIAKANKQQLSDDSKYVDYTNSKDLDYYIKAEGGDYQAKFGVYFFYTLNLDTNKLYLSQVGFY